MNYVYFLKSKRKNWWYIGSTRNLKKRFQQHELGHVRSTKAFRPFVLMYYETYRDISLARNRERHIKKDHSLKEEIIKRINGPIV